MFELVAFLALKSLADAAIVGTATAAAGGFIGNATDRILCKQTKRLLDWQNKTEMPENHDVLKVLRTAMLQATAMLDNYILNEPDTKKFKKKLTTYIKIQTDILEDLEKWATWQPAVYNHLDVFLQSHENSKTPHHQLGNLVTAEWITYLEKQLNLPMPLRHQTAFNNGFINNQNKKLHWHNIVLTIFSDIVKDPDNKTGTRARHALNTRFQVEIKQQLRDLKIEVKQGFDDVKDLITELQKNIPYYIDIKEAWDLIKSQNQIIADTTKEYENLRNDIEYERNEKAYERSQKEKYIKEGEKLRLEKDAMAAEIKELMAANRVDLNKYLELEERIKKFDDFIALHPELFADEYEALKEKRTAEEHYNSSQKAYEQATAKAEDLKAKLADAAFSYAHKLAQQLNYPLALEKYHEAVQLQTKNALYLNDLGSFLLTMGLFNEAIQFLSRALKNLDITNLQSEGTINNNIGGAYHRKGEFDKAIAYYQKALDIGKKINGEEHPDIANRYNNIGGIYSNKGEYDEAIEYYKKALTIDIKLRGEEHPKIATYYINIGFDYNNKGEYDKAVEYYNKALVIYKGEENPNIAICYNNIGLAYNNKGEYDKAIEYFEKALSIEKKLFGEEHPNIATRYNNIGAAYDDKAEYDKAINYYHKALTIDKKFHGQEHPNIARDYNNLGSGYCNYGDFKKAINYYNKALAIDKKFYGEEHLNIATYYNNIGAAYDCIGEYDNAINYFSKAIVINRKFYSKEHPNIAIIYNNIGVAYHSKDKYDKAIENYEKALPISIKFLGENHPTTSKLKKNLAAARQALSNKKK